MIQLFPKLQRNILIYSVLLIACMLLIHFLQPATSTVMLVVITIIGLIAILISQLSTATNMHNALLNTLYSQMDVDRFLREYEPKMALKKWTNTVDVMMRMHLSNAYVAQGRFKDAEAILKGCSLPEPKSPKQKEQSMLSRFAVTSNLCYVKEQEGDQEAAQAYLDELLDLKGQLEEIQKTKPENKQITFSTVLNEQCMAFLKTGKADTEVLRAQIKANPQTLPRVTGSLWLARAELAQNQRKEAQERLEKIVKLAPNLYPGKEAARILASLPSKPEEK